MVINGVPVFYLLAMAKRRMISKSISTSKKLAKVSDGAALLFVCLIPHCDDGGNMDADPMAVKGIVVPMRPVSVDEVEAQLNELVAADLITFYSGKKDEHFVHINQWENHQTIRNDRIDRRFPAYGEPTVNHGETFDGETPPNRTEPNLTKPNKYMSEPDGSDSASDRPKKKTKSQNAQGQTAFDTFWSAYPKKERKKQARDIWKRKQLDQKLEIILDFIAKAQTTDRWQRGYIKQPTTFLNAESWDDDLAAYGASSESRRPNAKGSLNLNEPDDGPGF